MYRSRDKAGSRFRPFSESAGLSHRCYTKRLQRAVCDFGADHPYGKVKGKISEHYGVDISDSVSSIITGHHAAKISKEMPENKAEICAKETVIVESDGSMIPVFSRQEDEMIKDKRKQKKNLHWKEDRLSMARAMGKVEGHFACTMSSTEVAGQQMKHCAEQVGANDRTYIHGIGDGAPWIASQVDIQFGSHGHYLIDFYHLCDYLSSASKVCDPHHDSEWLEIQKERMKCSDKASVLNALRPYMEAEDNDSTPVRDCYRYVDNRPTQFDYKNAIDKDLPIGSGEIESGHRYLLQKLLKISGAWWLVDHAQDMINLRVCRQNKLWDTYWAQAA